MAAWTGWGDGKRLANRLTGSVTSEAGNSRLLARVELAKRQAHTTEDVNVV
jgi:hypothetical protein